MFSAPSVQYVVVILCVLWIAVLIYMVISTYRMPLLRKQAAELAEEDGNWPLLSVIIPACNEGDHLEAALMSLLEQD